MFESRRGHLNLQLLALRHAWRAVAPKLRGFSRQRPRPRLTERQRPGTEPSDPARLRTRRRELTSTPPSTSPVSTSIIAAPAAPVTLGKHHLLIRAVPARPGLALHAVLDKSVSNLTLVRLQMQRVDMLLEEGDTL